MLYAKASCNIQEDKQTHTNQNIKKRDKNPEQKKRSFINTYEKIKP